MKILPYQAKKCKEEFYKLRNTLLENSDILISLTSDAKACGKNYAGEISYAKPISIRLLKNSTVSWSDLTLNLLHEYAHYLDYQKNKFTRRWRNVFKYRYDGRDIVKAPTYKRNVKLDMLKTEFIAESAVQDLLYKFDVNLFVSPHDLAYRVTHDMYSISHELLIGKYATKAFMRGVQKSFYDHPKKFTFTSFNQVKQLVY